MRKRILASLAALILLSMPAVAQDKAPPPPPPAEPDWGQIRKIAEAALKNQMFDPQSAQFTWHGGVRWGHVKPFKIWSKREWGWLGCLAVNAKNRLGGYVGASDFYVLIKPDGKVLTGPYSDVTSECDDGSRPVPLQPAFMDTTPSAGLASIADELEKLNALKEKGIITQAEFDAQKAKLLAR
jgi:hypothetical protein